MKLEIKIRPFFISDVNVLSHPRPILSDPPLIKLLFAQWSLNDYRFFCCCMLPSSLGDHAPLFYLKFKLAARDAATSS
jgi:hypothetical protein